MVLPTLAGSGSVTIAIHEPAVRRCDIALNHDALRSIPLLSELDQDALDFLVEHMQEVEVPIGGHIVKAGDYAYKFFAILQGTAVVSREGRNVAALNAGEVFGEMALLEDVSRNADVVAVSPMTLAVLMSWDFREAVHRFPSFSKQIDDLIAQRR